MTGQRLSAREADCLASTKVYQLARLLNVVHLHDEADVAAMGFENHTALLWIAAELACEVEALMAVKDEAIAAKAAETGISTAAQAA